MPNTESAKKRVRQGQERNARNRWRKSRVKDAVADFLKAIHDHDVAAAEVAFKAAVRTLDKVADTGTVHKNQAARRKSRLNAKLKTLKTAKSAKRA